MNNMQQMSATKRVSIPCKRMEIKISGPAPVIGRGSYAKVQSGCVRAASTSKKGKAKAAAAATSYLGQTPVAIKSALSPGGAGALRREAETQQRLAAAGGSLHVAQATAIGVKKTKAGHEVTSIVYPLLDSTLQQLPGTADGDKMSHFMLSLHQISVITLGVINGAIDMADLINTTHCDIKPANVMFARDDTCFERPMLIDMSEARDLGSETLMAIGTPKYSPPEMIAFPAGGMRITSAIDVWSIGVILGELVSATPAVRRTVPAGFEFGGCIPEGERHAAAARGSLLRQEMRALRDCVAAGSLPQVFVDTLERALEADPRARCTLAEMRALVTRGLRELEVNEMTTDSGSRMIVDAYATTVSVPGPTPDEEGTAARAAAGAAADAAADCAGSAADAPVEPTLGNLMTDEAPIKIAGAPAGGVSCGTLAVALTLAVASTEASLVTVNITVRADSCALTLIPPEPPVTDRERVMSKRTPLDCAHIEVSASACELQTGAEASPDARASLHACSAASESPASSRTTEPTGGSDGDEGLEADGRSLDASPPAPESPSGPGASAVAEALTEVLGESEVPPRECEVDVVEVTQAAHECARAHAPIAELGVLAESARVKVTQPAPECSLQIVVHDAERASTIGSVATNAPTATVDLDCADVADAPPRDAAMPFVSSAEVADAPPQDAAIPFVSKLFFDMSDEKLIRRTPKSKKISSHMKRQNKKVKREESKRSEEKGTEGPLRLGCM